MQNTPHQCLRCGNLLMARVAVGGNFPGHPYIHCPPPCNFHRTFFPVQGSSPTPTQSQGVPPLGNRPSRALCVVCSKPANGNCGNRMCKNDCIVSKGGCHLSDHKPHRLNKRQLEEKTKHPKKPVERVALATCFTVVFWKYRLAEPVILAIHNCSLWPKWVLEDATDLYDDFGFDLDAAPSSRKLQFYSLEASRWISCASGFPHSVTKNGYLLLRARDLESSDCLDFGAFKKLALQSHDDALKVHQGHINIISPGDVVSEKARLEACCKRQREDVELDSPVRKRRFSSPLTAPFSPPWLSATPEGALLFLARSKAPVTPQSRSCSWSLSITVSSPCRILSSSPSITTTSPQPIL